MNLYALDDEVAALEAAGPVKLEDRLALAWHLRQRDSRRALALAAEAEPQLAAGDRAGHARLALLRAEIAGLLTDYEEAERQLALAHEGFNAVGDAIGQGDTLLVEVHIALAKGQVLRYTEAQERAGVLYAAAGDAKRELLAQAWIGLRLAYTSAPQAQQWLERHGLWVGPATGALASIRDTALGIIEHPRQPARAALLLEQACRDAEAAGLISHALSAAGNAGAALEQLGDLDGAARMHDWAAERARTTGWPATMGMTLMRLGALMCQLGQLERSRRLLHEATGHFATVPAGPNKSATLYYLGQTELRLGHAEAAAAAAEQAAGMARQIQTWANLAGCLLLQARALAALGRAEAALAVLGEAGQLAAEQHMTKAEVDRCEALAELHRDGLLPSDPAAAGAPSAQLHYLEQALAVGTRIEQWQPPARLLLALSQAWEAVGDPTRALSHARAALAAQERDALDRAARRAELIEARHQSERSRAEFDHQQTLLTTLGQHVQTLDRLSLVGRELTATLDSAAVVELLQDHGRELLQAQRVELRLDGAATEPSAAGVLRQKLNVGPREIGVLEVHGAAASGERERLVLRSLASYGAIALDNAQAHEQLQSALEQLEQLSLTDPLTGLRNRRFLTQAIEVDIAMCLRRYEDPTDTRQDADLIFLLVDLDHFKRINDEHGHAAGDAVLKQMKARLQLVFRDSDHLVRWGGEEFLIVARGTGRARAAELAERIRQVICEQPFALADGDDAPKLERSCSIGFACFPFVPQQPRQLGWEDVVDMADLALYAGKRGGRNAWVGLQVGAMSPDDLLLQRAKTGAAALLASGELKAVSSLSDQQLATGF